MAETTTAPVEQQATKEGLEGQNGEGQNGTGTQSQPQITDELGLGWLAERGIKVESMDTLKQKVDYTPPPPPPTDAEKEKSEKEQEKKLVNLFLSKKGTTPEQYAYLKTLVAADPKDIGIQKIKEDLVKDGFSAENAEKIARKMHLQISDEELETIEDEKERDVLKKERDFGSKKQQSRGLYIQSQAKSVLDQLNSELQELENEKQLMEQHSATVAEAIKNFPKKQTLEMGQIDGQDIAPVDFEVSEKALTETEAIVKDLKVFEEQHLYNKDGQLNLDFLLPHLVRSFSYAEAVKKGYLVGGDRQVEFFKGTFGTKVPLLGADRKPDGKGTIVGYGQPQVAQRPATK